MGTDKMVHDASSRTCVPVSVVIPTWNSEQVIEPCLRAVWNEAPAEVLVIDNHSSDRTVDRVRQISSRTRVIELPENRGFSAACNLGIRGTTQCHVLLLNDDACLMPGYLETLVAELEKNPDAASATGKLVFELNGRTIIDSAGIRLCRHALRPLDRGHGCPDRGQFDSPEDIFGPSATAALYRRSALEVLGDEVFDEELFAYYEDVDVAWRLGHLGWRHLYVPTAVAHHRRKGPGDKPGRLPARAFANRYIVWLKNESAVRFLSYALCAIPWEIVRLAVRFVKNPAELREVPRVFALIPPILSKRNGL